MAEKAAGTGQFLIPTAPAVGVTVTGGAANTFSASYVTLLASTAAAVYITGVHMELASASKPTYVVIQLATGGAGSESVIGQMVVPYAYTVAAAATQVMSFVPIWPPIPVATGTRISAKTADSVGSLAHTVILTAINQSNVVDAGINMSANVLQWNTTNVASPATAGIPDVNVKNINDVAAATPGASGGVVIVGTNSAAVSFTAGLTISNASGDALVLTSSGSNGNGINITANGTGVGIRAPQGITASITGSLSGSVGSVTGSVGSVTGNVSGAVASVVGAVGSVTGNVGGNVVGSVASVTGAVGSVTGNVSGSVVGSVASVVGAVGSVTGNVSGSVASVVGLNAAYIDAAITSRLAPTVSGRTLDVNATGGAGIDWGNIDNPTTTINFSGTTVGTITTYTGDTPQTGDSFARIGATGSGLTSLAPASTALSNVQWTNTRAALLDHLDADVSSRLASSGYTAPLSASGTRSAVGLASANMDTQFSALNSAVVQPMTESYATVGSAATLAQLLYELRAMMTSNSVAGVTVTTRKLDGTTTAHTYTINDAATPTAIIPAT